MKTRLCLIGILITAIAGGTAVSSFAQQNQRKDPINIDQRAGSSRSALSESRREEVMKKIEALRIWRLTDALKLDETTAAKLAALLGSIDRQREAVLRDQRTTMHDLRALANSEKPDKAALKTLLDRVEKNRHTMQELRNNEFSGVKDILPVEQQARYVIFQQDFRREVRRIISGGRGGRAARGRRGSDRVPGMSDVPQQESIK